MDSRREGPTLSAPVVVLQTAWIDGIAKHSPAVGALKNAPTPMVTGLYAVLGDEPLVEDVRHITGPVAEPALSQL